MRDTLEKIFRKLEEIQQVMVKNTKPFMNVEECASYMGISKNSLYAKTSRNEIPFYYIGKRLTFKTSEINDWILDRRKKVMSMDEIESEVATRILTEGKRGDNEKV